MKMKIGSGRGTRVFVSDYGVIISFPGNDEEQEKLEKIYTEVYAVRSARINMNTDDLITATIEVVLDVGTQKELNKKGNDDEERNA